MVRIAIIAMIILLPQWIWSQIQIQEQTLGIQALQHQVYVGGNARASRVRGAIVGLKTVEALQVEGVVVALLRYKASTRGIALSAGFTEADRGIHGIGIGGLKVDAYGKMNGLFCSAGLIENSFGIPSVFGNYPTHEQFREGETDGINWVAVAGLGIFTNQSIHGISASGLATYANFGLDGLSLSGGVLASDLSMNGLMVGGLAVVSQTANLNGIAVSGIITGCYG